MGNSPIQVNANDDLEKNSAPISYGMSGSYMREIVILQSPTYIYLSCHNRGTIFAVPSIIYYLLSLLAKNVY